MNKKKRKKEEGGIICIYISLDSVYMRINGRRERGGLIAVTHHQQNGSTFPFGSIPGFFLKKQNEKNICGSNVASIF